ALRGEVTMDDLSVQHRDTGTFPVWYETALSPGVFGTLTQIVGQGSTSGLREMVPPSVLTGPSSAHIPPRIGFMLSNYLFGGSRIGNRTTGCVSDLGIYSKP